MPFVDRYSVNGLDNPCRTSEKDEKTPTIGWSLWSILNKACNLRQLLSNSNHLKVFSVVFCLGERDLKRFLLLSLLFLPIPTFAGIGDTDNRYYVTDEMWAQEPYKKFVLLYAGVSYDDAGSKSFIKIGNCSAQYISPNLILSAGHCIYTEKEFLDTMGKYNLDPNDFSRDYQITDYKQNKFFARLVDTEYDGSIVMPGDWAVWLVTDQKYYSDAYFNVKTPIKTIDVINAGWGFVRIISDYEMNNIRKIYNDIKKMIEEENLTSEFKKSTSISGLSDYIDERCELYGMKKFSEETDRLKASECKMVFSDCSDLASNIEKSTQKGKNQHKKQTKFQNICNNQAGLYKHEYPNMLATTCDTWQGNSGGGFVSTDGQYVYGIVSGGVSSFEDDSNSCYATSAKQFDKRIKELIKKYDSKNPIEENIARIPTNLYGDTADLSPTESESVSSVQDSEEQQIRWSNGKTDLEALSNKILNDLSNKKNLTDEQLLTLLDNIAEHKIKSQRLEELQKAYEAAKAREQSLANKILSGATMAATGIGGMQLASGLSEQQSDKDAENAMRAYLATFTCKYGDNRVSGGKTDVELPGGNELIGLYSEYVALANDLKTRKAALGIKPGIESEPILDSATGGLYDDAGLEVRPGAYTSLSRALSDPNGADAAAWAAQKEESSKQVTTGATVGGVGAAGGAIGNLIINSDRQ